MIVLTPEELADAFCDMDSDQQAKFFNSIANITSSWDSKFYFQLQHITIEDILSDGARKLMKLIGEYSKKQPT